MNGPDPLGHFRQGFNGNDYDDTHNSSNGHNLQAASQSKSRPNNWMVQIHWHVVLFHTLACETGFKNAHAFGTLAVKHYGGFASPNCKVALRVLSFTLACPWPSKINNKCTFGISVGQRVFYFSTTKRKKNDLDVEVLVSQRTNPIISIYFSIGWKIEISSSCGDGCELWYLWFFRGSWREW